MPFTPSRFPLYMDSLGNVSSQIISRSGPPYGITAANVQGYPLPPTGRPFTCTPVPGSATQSTFGFSLTTTGLNVAQQNAWKAAFAAGNRTVWVSMNIGPLAEGGTEWLTIDLRMATAVAALSQTKSAAAGVAEESVMLLRSLVTAAQFLVVGFLRLFKKKQEPEAALASGDISKRIE